MSLESQLAELVAVNSKLVDYFNNKKAGIDTAVAAAIAAVPETIRNWYVDQVNGSDANAGTLIAPFRTIGKAIASTPNFGLCNVRLLSDYVINESISVTCSNVFVVGEGAIRTLSPKYFQTPNADGVTYSTALGSFLLTNPATNIEFRNVNVALPSSSGVNPAPVFNRLTGFIRTNSTGNVPPFLGVALAAVQITMAVDFVGALIGSTVSAISLSAISTTFPSGFAGKYVMGVAAGAAPKDTPNVLSNLSTL